VSELPELPASWNWTLLPDLGTLARGRSRHRPRYDPILYENGTIPFVQTGDIKAANKHLMEYTQTYNDVGLAQSKLWPKGTLCITIAANIAETAILGIDACFPDSVVGFIPDEKKCDLGYIFYFLCYAQSNIQNLAYGSVQNNINLQTFENLPIPLPPLPTQRRIAQILGRLDDKIELNRRINRTLEAMAQALYKHHFVDFGPYQHGEFVDSELGSIPKGWGVSNIGSVCEVVNGGTPRTKISRYWDGDIYWATPTDMTALTAPVIFETERKITQLGLENSSAKLLPVGAVLVTSRATLGVAAIAHVPITTNQGFKSMVSGSQVTNHYLLLYIQNNQDALESNANGSTFLEINSKNFKALPVVVPPPDIMERFEVIVKPFFDKIYLNEQENRKLAGIRDYLLPRLLSGEIEVEV